MQQPVAFLSFVMPCALASPVRVTSNSLACRRNFREATLRFSGKTVNRYSSAIEY